MSSTKVEELPEKWQCSMNTTDSKHSKCSDPQETYNHNHGSKSNAGFTPQVKTPRGGNVECVADEPPADRNSKRPQSGSSSDPIDVEANNSTKPAIPSFETAIPTYTHRALTHMILQPPPAKDGDANDDTTQRTFLNHVVTQNIDGLHRKSRLPRKHQSILHGDIFTEVCDTCHTEYVRPHEIESIGLSYTGVYRLLFFIQIILHRDICHVV
jgi:hypothetical protein